ncbi:MAG: ParB N-terminal domain-containing protein [Pseudomonadota bacterium]
MITLRNEGQPVPVERILVGERLRPVREEGVEALLRSISDLGDMTDAILVRRLQGDDEHDWELMAGGHRLEAARRLGWDTIRARCYECSVEEARLFEIDDNVAQSGLTPLDFAVFMAERKRAYEAIHPETRHGGDRMSRKFQQEKQDRILPFCSAAAGVWGKSRSAIERAVGVGSLLDDAAVDQLQAAGRTLTFVDLKALSKLPAMDQRRVAATLVQDPRANVAKAQAALGKAPRKALENPEDDAAAKLVAQFERAKKPVRRRVLRTLMERHPALFLELAGAGEA